MPSNQLEAILQCGCGCGEGGCCLSRSCPSEGLPNPLPLSLTIEWTATINDPPSGNPPGSPYPDPPNSNCYNFTMTVELEDAACLDGIVSYYGNGVHTCSWCNQDFTIGFNVLLQCNRQGVEGAGASWILIISNDGTTGCNFNITDAYRIQPFTVASCDPILLSGDMDACIQCSAASMFCNLGLWEPFPGVEVPIIVLHPPFCLSALVYETP